MNTAGLLVLASASSARAKILTDAGIDHLCDPAAVDEAAVKDLLGGEMVENAALALAEAKAKVVSARHPGSLVLGADQILECEGTWFDKPADTDAASRHLRCLRGRTHRLISAMAAVRDQRVVWHHVDTANLTMRAFDDAFIARYLDRAGPEALESVGAYRVEGPGIQLFSGIDGDLFTILGLPLLPLLEFLRREGMLKP
jgi:septum formation protein